MEPMSLLNIRNFLFPSHINLRFTFQANNKKLHYCKKPSNTGHEMVGLEVKAATNRIQHFPELEDTGLNLPQSQIYSIYSDELLTKCANPY